MIDLGTINLIGKEVTLRPLTSNDAAALHEASSGSREKYRYNPVPNGLIEAKEYVEKALIQKMNGFRYPFVVIWKGIISGTTSYSDFQPWTWPEGSENQRTDRPDVLEIGYTWISSSAQRTRCNTEAKYLLATYAFEELNVHRVSLRTDERNEASRKAIERIGACFEGIRRADMPSVDGSVRNSAFYSILRSEWPTIKQRLESKMAQQYSADNVG